MKRTAFVAWLLCSLASVWAVDVPLEWVKEVQRSSPQLEALKVASVKIADFDMSAAGAKEPGISILPEQETGSAGVVVGSTKVVDAAGKKALTNSDGSPVFLRFPKKVVATAPIKDPYVQVEYLDDSGPGTKLVIYCKATTGRVVKEIPSVFGKSGKWKTVQAQLQGVEIDPKELSRAMMYVYSQPEGAGGESGSISAVGYAGLEARSKVPSGDYKLPQLKAKQPMFAEAEIGKLKRLFVADQIGESGAYDVIYWDANGNKDLTDDAPVKATKTSKQGSINRAEFPTIETSVDTDGTSLSFAFVPDAYAYGSPMQPSGAQDRLYNVQFTLRTAGHWEGKLELDGKTYKVALGDSNCNGRFDEQFTISSDQYNERLGGEGDQFILVQGREQKSQVLGDRLIVNGKCHDVKVKMAEKKIQLTPNEEPKATIRFAAAPKYIQLFSSNPTRGLMIMQAAQEMQIPAGKYRFYDYTIEKQDAQGDTWSLEGQATTGTKEVDVSGATPAEMKMAEPFNVAVNVQPWAMQNWRINSEQADPSKGGSGGGLLGFFGGSSSSSSSKPVSELQMDFRMSGIADEMVTALAHTSGTATKIVLSKQDSSKPVEPTYKIMKPDGEQVAQGAFEYG